MTEERDYRHGGPNEKKKRNKKSGEINSRDIYSPERQARTVVTVALEWSDKRTALKGGRRYHRAHYIMGKQKIPM